MIDWNKAPEGATHYCSCNSNFYKVGCDETLWWWDGNGWSFSWYKDIATFPYTMVRRPIQKESAMKGNVFIRVKNLGEFNQAKELLGKMGYVNNSQFVAKGMILYGLENSVDSGWDVPEVNPLEEYPRKEYKEIFLKERHIHHDLIVQWASDPLQKVWAKHKVASKWLTAGENPAWWPNIEYYIGDNPPRETIRIGGFDVPKPLSGNNMVCGRSYYYPQIHLESASYGVFYYQNLSGKCANLHETVEDALLHAEALRSLTA